MGARTEGGEGSREVQGDPTRRGHLGIDDDHAGGLGNIRMSLGTHGSTLERLRKRKCHYADDTGLSPRGIGNTVKPGRAGLLVCLLQGNGRGQAGPPIRTAVVFWGTMT